MIPAAPHNQALSPSQDAATFGTRPDFEMFFDILKSTTAEDGRVWVSGIASDQSEDEDNEIVKAVAYPKSIEYLKRFGKFNYDHHAGIIGDITHADFISPAEARRKYSVGINGHGIEVEGWVAPLASDPTNADLRDIHRLIKSGSKLGFSPQGSYHSRDQVQLKDGRTVTVGVPRFIPQVAITPQPKNSNALCFVKSLAQAVCADSLAGEDAQAETTRDWPVVICPALTPVSPEAPMHKALECTGVPAVGGTQNGDALKLEDLAGGVAGASSTKAKRRKRKSSGELDEEVDEDKETDEMRKSVLELIDSLALLGP